MFDSLPTIADNFADYSRQYEVTRHNGYATGLYSNPRPAKYYIAKSHVPYVVTRLGLRRANVVTSTYAVGAMGRTLRLSRVHILTCDVHPTVCDWAAYYQGIRLRPSRVRVCRDFYREVTRK